LHHFDMSAVAMDKDCAMPTVAMTTICQCYCHCTDIMKTTRIIIIIIIIIITVMIIIVIII